MISAFKNLIFVAAIFSLAACADSSEQNTRTGLNAVPASKDANAAAQSQDAHNIVNDAPAIPTPAPTPIDPHTVGQTPVVWNMSTIKYSNASVCPENNVLIAIDDASMNMGACAPLPAKDILVADKPIHRTACLVGEVGVGIDSTGFTCAKINAERYKLGAPQTSCTLSAGMAGVNTAIEKITCAIPQYGHWSPDRY